MIPARHTCFHTWFFRWYTEIRLKRNFSRILIHPPIPDITSKPLLIIGNHYSWWDGFFILWLNNRFWHKKFHVMMLEEQLRQNMILNKTGAFSIRRGSRDALESLKYANGILSDRTYDDLRPGESPMLLIYPQGEIQSMHAGSLKFERGIEIITRNLEGQINILMVVTLVDYFSNQKPELHFYLELFQFNKNLKISDLETSFNRFLEHSKGLQIKPEIK